MASIMYEKVFSNFLGEVSDIKFASLEEYEMMEILQEHLHRALAESYLRRCFSSLTLDDDDQMLRYSLKHEVDADTDEEFVINAAAKMMVYKWWANKVNNITLAAQALVGAEQKFYSQANHLTEMRAARDSALAEAQGFIRDRNAMFNSHLDGNK